MLLQRCTAANETAEQMIFNDSLQCLTNIGVMSARRSNLESVNYVVKEPAPSKRLCRTRLNQSDIPLVIAANFKLMIPHTQSCEHMNSPPLNTHGIDVCKYL